MSHRLTFAMKKEIAERYAGGEIAPVLADEYCITESTVRKIASTIYPGFRKLDDKEDK